MGRSLHQLPSALGVSRCAGYFRHLLWSNQCDGGAITGESVSDESLSLFALCFQCELLPWPVTVGDDDRLFLSPKDGWHSILLSWRVVTWPFQWLFRYKSYDTAPLPSYPSPLLVHIEVVLFFPSDSRSMFSHWTSDCPITLSLFASLCSLVEYSSAFFIPTSWCDSSLYCFVVDSI